MYVSHGAKRKSLVQRVQSFVIGSFPVVQSDASQEPLVAFGNVHIAACRGSDNLPFATAVLEDKTVFQIAGSSSFFPSPRTLRRHHRRS